MDHTPSKGSLSAETASVIAPVRWVAHFVSYVFHPIFIPTLAVGWLAFFQPGFFTGVPEHEKFLVLVRVAVNTLFFPALTVLLLKALGFIKSVYLNTQRDRIIPYVASNIFYFWMYQVFSHQPDVPRVITAFMFGVFLSSAAGLLANIYFKISMHGLGMGALSGLALVIIFSGFSYPLFVPAMIIFFLSGLVCTSRLIVSNHSLYDINSGILMGILCQLIAAIFIG